MPHPAPQPVPAIAAPPQYRDALAELVQVGLKVARMVGHSADAESGLAEAAAQAGAAENVSPLATSLAEAIEADRAAAAAAETRQTVAARTTAVAMAYARVSRAIRLTIMLAERLDRGWARGGAPDDRQAMAKRHIARAVHDAIARESEGERADDLAHTLAERLETLDTEDALTGRAPEAIIAMICRDLGLDPACMAVRAPLPDATGMATHHGAAPFILATPNHRAPPPPRRPDG